MSWKPKSAFDVHAARPIRLTELQPGVPMRADADAASASGRGETPPPHPDWLPPRRPTRGGMLSELARWLGYEDVRALRAAADAGEVRIGRLSADEFSACMLDIARRNPRCLVEAAPD